jgi:hypothetical protein
MKWEGSGSSGSDPHAVTRSGGFVELDHGEAAQRFVRDLGELRERAGRPSYSTLERLSDHELKRATMSDILNGNRVRVPEWRFVAAFVTACRAAAEGNGLDPSTLGTVADWKRHWDGASHGVPDARVPGSGHQSPEGRDQPELAVKSLPGSVAESGYPAIAGDLKHVKLWPAIWGSVPPRLPDFIGREEWLAGLRGALAVKGLSSAVVIQGLCGIGKTQLTVEYAHRAASEYDLVWWIPCDDMESARAALAGLETALGLDDALRAPGEGRYARLFDLLQQGERSVSWLLIFDNAEPDLVRDLIPPITGHVLVTSRNSRWEATSEMLELDAFSRAESLEFLRRRMPRFDATAAHELADAAGDLPLVLEHAVESQLDPADYISRLAADPLSLLDSQPADYGATVASQWRDLLAQLDARAPDALGLLRCLAYFGSTPIPREALERGSYLPNISLHALLVDPIRRNRAILILRRAGLLRIRAEARTLEVHQITRCVVRAMVGGGGQADAERSRHDVHLLLAAADPLDPDDPSNWRSYEELHGHAAQAVTEACPDSPVREFVVNLARSRITAGEPRSALTLASTALSRWVQDAGGTLGPSDGQLAMLNAKAEALLACGLHTEAAQLQRETLAAMQATPGQREAEIVSLGRMTGAHCRVAGDFVGALTADQESARHHEEHFGRDHPQTFHAVNKVVTDLALNGKYREAVAEAERVHSDCRDFYNDGCHPTVLFERNALGSCLRLAGRYDDAVSVISQAHAGYGKIVQQGTIGDNHPWRLAHEVDYAAARRDKGLIAGELEALASHLQDVRRRCWRTLGAGHPQTLAATTTLGSVLGRISGRVGDAARILADAESRYRSALPDHPFAHACRGFAAAIRYRAGIGGTDPGLGPVPELRGVIASLTASVGRDHPLCLAAISELANVLADIGELEAGADCGLAVLGGFRNRLGPDHPHALACEANVATICARLGQKASFGDLRGRYDVVMGAGHPDVRLFAEGKLIYLDFTPLPL